MNNQISLKEIEHKAYLSYHNDGLLDILVGFTIICFALSIIYDFAAFVGVYSGLGFMVMTAAKKRITIPRAGIVKFGPERELRINLEKSFFQVFFLITTILAVVVFFLVAKKEYALDDLMRTFIFAPLGIIGAAGLSFLAFWKKLRRYYIYAVLILLTVFGGPYTGFEPPYYLMIGGITILIPGFIVLARFMKTYPVSGNEA